MSLHLLARWKIEFSPHGKPFFLLTLASTKRASDIQAFSRDKRGLVFSGDGVSLRTIPGFLAKTQVVNVDPKPFFVPRHDSFSGRDTPDRFFVSRSYVKILFKVHRGTCRWQSPVCEVPRHRCRRNQNYFILAKIDYFLLRAGNTKGP